MNFYKIITGVTSSLIMLFMVSCSHDEHKISEVISPTTSAFNMTLDWTKKRAVLEENLSKDYRILESTPDFMLVSKNEDSNNERIYLQFADGKLNGYSMIYHFNPESEDLVTAVTERLEYVGEEAEETGKLYIDKKINAMVTSGVFEIKDTEAIMLTYSPMEVPKSIEVENQVITLDDHEAVDLGLSVKWATVNLGASSYAKQGSTFAWGETTSRFTNFNFWTYQYYSHPSDNYYDSSHVKRLGNIEGTRYDAATKLWGGGWKMPTRAQMRELVQFCTWVRIDSDEFNGYKIIGPNSHYIYLPYTERIRKDSSFQGPFYWSATESSDYAYYLSGYYEISSDMKWVGMSIRAVHD